MKKTPIIIWKEIWEAKGKIDSKDKKLLNGYEKTIIEPKEVAESITKLLGITKETKVLEVGCGAGMLAEFLDCDYTGVDYSLPLVKKHCQLLGNNVICAEANNLPFGDNQFEVVYAYSIFQYFPTKEYAMKTIGEMLRVSSEKIFIGDLARKSHSQDHMLYPEVDMRMLGFETFKGYYNPDRYNAWKKI